MSRALRLFLATVVVLLAAPSVSHAARCSDFSNQAAAQQAANTKDADGDGIYCESLPCPCSRGGSSGGGGGGQANRPRKPKVSLSEKRRHKLERPTWRITSVVDGDTIRVKRTDAQVYETVRLIGIDTPETHKPGVGIECGGEAATEHMQAMSFGADGKGRRVKLRTDRSQDVRDRYGRALAYVKKLNGVDLNRMQVSAGLANTYVYGGKPFQRYASYQRAKKQAKKARRGSWKACGGNFHSKQ